MTKGVVHVMWVEIGMDRDGSAELVTMEDDFIKGQVRQREFPHGPEPAGGGGVRGEGREEWTSLFLRLAEFL